MKMSTAAIGYFNGSKGCFKIMQNLRFARLVGLSREASLTPRVSANKALRFMNTEELTAPRTGPPFLFISHEMSYAELLYVHEIVDHAHAVVGPIAFIQVIQSVARKPVTARTVPDLALSYLLTVLDPAGDAGLWFDAVVAPTAGACVLIPCICATKATVHSTGSNQCRPDSIGHCWSCSCHVRVPARPASCSPFFNYICLNRWV